jgi:hypothetical protein
MSVISLTVIIIIITIIIIIDGFDAGTNDLRTINSNIRIAAIRCSLGTLFVSGIYV